MEPAKDHTAVEASNLPLQTDLHHFKRLPSVRSSKIVIGHFDLFTHVPMLSEQNFKEVAVKMCRALTFSWATKLMRSPACSSVTARMYDRRAHGANDFSALLYVGISLKLIHLHGPPRQHPA